MLFSRCDRPFVGWSHRFSFNHPDGMCTACKGLGKRITVDVDKLLDLDRSIEEGAIRHPAYDIGKWYWREIVQTEVVPPRKPLRRFTAAERERLLWADDVRTEKVHQGATYERTFEGVARKLGRLHVDKDEDQIPRAGKEDLSAVVHRADVPRLRWGSAQRRGAGGRAGGRLDCWPARRLRADGAGPRARGARRAERLRTDPRRRHDAGRPDTRAPPAPDRHRRRLPVAQPQRAHAVRR